MVACLSAAVDSQMKSWSGRDSGQYVSLYCPKQVSLFQLPFQEIQCPLMLCIVEMGSYLYWSSKISKNIISVASIVEYQYSAINGIHEMGLHHEWYRLILAYL